MKMKKWLVVILTLVFFAGVAVPAVYGASPGHAKVTVKAKKVKEAKFKDITGHWAENVLFEMNARGFIQGYQDRTIKPSNIVTNLEALVMIVRALGLEDEAQEADLSVSLRRNKQIPAWAAGYVQIAYEKGIITAGELNSFKPNQGAQRIYVAVMISRALDLDGRIQNKMLLTFKDNKDIPKDFYQVVSLMVESGIMQGNSGNCFLPNKPITRAEMAVLLERIDGKTGNQDFTGLNGVIESVDSESVTVGKNGRTKEFDWADDVTVYLDGKKADVEDLEEGFRVQLVLDDDGDVIFVKAEDVENEKDFTGKIIQIVLGKDSQLTIKSGSKEYTFEVDSSTEIEKDDEELFLAELEIGWEISVEAEGNLAREIEVESESEDDEEDETEYEGVISGLTIGTSPTISIKDEDGHSFTFRVTDDTELVLDDDQVELKDLRPGYTVKVEVDGDEAERVEAETVVEEYEGEIVALSYGTEMTIKIETDNDDEVTISADEDTIIKIDGESAEFEDLRIGDEVEIETDGDQVAVKIDVDR